MKPFKDWPIVRTILGKNSVGKKLHQLLPLKKPREVIGAVLRGASDLSPVPNAKDASIREKAEKIYRLTSQLKAAGPVQDKAVEAVEAIHDLLDDGVINDSAELSPEQRKTIRVYTSFGIFMLGAYEVLAVLFGWPSVLRIVLALGGI